jgi:hypothetical protein
MGANELELWLLARLGGFILQGELGAGWTTPEMIRRAGRCAGDDTVD